MVGVGAVPAEMEEPMTNEPLLDEDEETPRFSAQDIAEHLSEILQGLSMLSEDKRIILFEDLGFYDDLPVKNVRTYEEVQMMTMDAGVVFSLQNGDSFTLTVQPYRGWAL